MQLAYLVQQGVHCELAMQEYTAKPILLGLEHPHAACGVVLKTCTSHAARGKPWLKRTQARHVFVTY